MTIRCPVYWTLYEKLCACNNLNTVRVKQKMQEHLRACPQCSAWWREVKNKFGAAQTNSKKEGNE